MTAAKTPTQKDKLPAARRPGRRPRSDDGRPAPSREAVVQCALNIARNESLAEVSMVRVARDMGVAGGLVHYYAGSRDDLLSAVINVAFKERLEALPEPTGDWRADLEGIARATLEVTARWPGLGGYIMGRNRFRLFQRVESGETDYGLVWFDRIGQVLRDSGFAPPSAALVFHLMMLFVVTIAVERENRQAPGMHEDFIVNYVAQFDPASVPGAAFLVGPFAKIDNKTTFETGLRLLLDGFEGWRTAAPAPAGVKRKPTSR